jgi:hypothetical protein
MEEKRIAGLLKFFDCRDYLEDLLGGLVYFNTPERHRLDRKEGRGDPHESCRFAFRKERGDLPIQMTFAGKEIKEILGLTMHNGGRKEGWLHCWSAILLPADLNELRRLRDDINRLREEFGKRYVFLPGDRINRFTKALRGELQAESADVLDHGLVEYSSSEDERGVWCKSSTFAYQREYRFVLGECGHTEASPKIVRCPAGFKDIVFSGGAFRIHGDRKGEVLLELDEDGCRLLADLPSGQPAGNT